jgi:hypothetical protein
MSKKQESLTLFEEAYTSTLKLSDEQFGALMRAAFRYRFEGTSYSGDDSCVDMAFQFISNQIDRYAAACDSKAAAARERWKASERQTGDTQDGAGTKSTDESKRVQKVQGNAPILSVPIQSNPIQSKDSEGPDKPPTRSKQFVRPTLDEVRAYCQARKNDVDPQRFLDFYEASDWTRGKSKIKDWRACVRTWESNGAGAKPWGTREKSAATLPDYSTEEEFSL